MPQVGRLQHVSSPMKTLNMIAAAPALLCFGEKPPMPDSIWMRKGLDGDRERHKDGDGVVMGTGREW